METTTRVYFESATEMGQVDDGSVQLVVTSPPYPMIEMWDALFAALDPEIALLLEAGRAEAAFQRMHDVLRPVWRECHRVLASGGILCINIGDATRSVDGRFQLFSNHAAIIRACTDAGFHALPSILWRKSTNKPTKFMGSGMVAPNAYVTLEHEHVLIFRKGPKRTVPPERRDHRYESAYFWEERNRWFSDLWTSLNGTAQQLPDSCDGARERSAAFPLALPRRLIHMYSIYGDIVLDPFWGTGTTSLAAAQLGRHAIGYELDSELWSAFAEQADRLPALSASYNRRRLKRHAAFVDRCEKPLPYRNRFYEIPVKTRQEESLRLYAVEDARPSGPNRYTFRYAPFVTTP